MPLPKATPIELTARQRAVLEKIASKQKAEYRQVIRAQILLKAADGWTNKQIAKHLHLKRDTVILWRNRWNEMKNALPLSKTTMKTTWS